MKGLQLALTIDTTCSGGADPHAPSGLPNRGSSDGSAGDLQSMAVHTLAAFGSSALTPTTLLTPHEQARAGPLSAPVAGGGGGDSGGSGVSGDNGNNGGNGGNGGKAGKAGKAVRSGARGPVSPASSAGSGGTTNVSGSEGEE